MVGAARYFRAVSSGSEKVAAIRGKDFIFPPGAAPQAPDPPRYIQRVVKCGHEGKEKISCDEDPYWAVSRFAIVASGAVLIAALSESPKLLWLTGRRKKIELTQEIASLEKLHSEKEEEYKANLLSLRERRAECQSLQKALDKKREMSWYSWRCF